MIELLQKYSITEVIVFFIIAGISIKNFISFWDWGYERLKKVFKKENDQGQQIDSIHVKIDEYRKDCEFLKDNQEQLKNTLFNLTKQIDLLVDSDKDNIKSFITERHHHFCYEEEWIDDYSLDCIEKRYKHYVDEGGNSFIHDLMEELRELPKQPPQNYNKC